SRILAWGGTRESNPISADRARAMDRRCSVEWASDRIEGTGPIMSNDPPNWKHQFASDNVSPVCPEAWAALEHANRDFAPPYGADPVTARARQLIRALFETDCEVFF